MHLHPSAGDGGTGACLELIHKLVHLVSSRPLRNHFKKKKIGRGRTPEVQYLRLILVSICTCIHVHLHMCVKIVITEHHVERLCIGFNHYILWALSLTPAILLCKWLTKRVLWGGGRGSRKEFQLELPLWSLGDTLHELTPPWGKGAMAAIGSSPQPVLTAAAPTDLFEIWAGHSFYQVLLIFP